MWGLLWSALLCYGAAALGPLETFYTQTNIQKHIEIRLMKRTWKPVGPSASTDDVMEEYQWDVAQAFKSLRGSKWQYEAAPLQEVEKLYKSDNYDKNLDTILIMHPILASAEVFFVKTTINALAMRNLHKKYNIFALNMPYNNPRMMLSVFLTVMRSTTYFEPMAEAVSQFLVVGVDGGYLQPGQIHLIGWSYSGQMAGYMGRYIHSKYGTKIASIASLDPFSIGWGGKLVSLSADDADVVHIYHSNSVMAGTRRRIGTADFVFNDGNIQPECRFPRVLHSRTKESNTCSHMRVVPRFWYIILYPSKFLGRKCASWTRLTDCFCEQNPTHTISYPIKTDSQAKGTYYLRTLDKYPYGLGKRGVSCSSDKLLNMETAQQVTSSEVTIHKEPI